MAQHRALTTRIGEPAMSRKSMTLQLDLFSCPRGCGVTQTPPWQSLPAETRQVLTSLIVRLFLNHADGGSAATRKEMHDDP
jgi:hypothetical protein